MDLMKFNLPSLQDGDDCNDDAWLLSEAASILVICDGIGSLRLHNLNGFQLPCEVARDIISRRIWNRRPFPKDDLPATVYRSLVEREEVGATTVMLAYMTESGALQTFNMGDSGWVLLRIMRGGEKTCGLEIVGRSKETSRSFNEPLQLCTVSRRGMGGQRGGMGMGGRPRSLSVDGYISVSAAAGPWESELWSNCQNADMQLVATAPGDILIGFTDGFLDNVTDDEILQIASQWLETAAEKGEEGPPNPDDLALALAREAFRKGCKYSWEEMDKNLYDPHLMDYGWPADRPDWQTEFVKEFARRHPRQNGTQAMGGKPDDVTVTVCVIDSAETLKGRDRGAHGDETGGREPRLPLHHPRSASSICLQLSESDEHHPTSSGLWTVESSTGKPFPSLPCDSEKWGLLGNCSDQALLAAGYARGDPLMPTCRRNSAPARPAEQGQHADASSGPAQSLSPPQASGRGQASQPAVQLPQTPHSLCPSDAGGGFDLQPSESNEIDFDTLEESLEGFIIDETLDEFINAELKQHSPLASLQKAHSYGSSLGSSQVPKPAADEDIPLPEPEPAGEENAADSEGEKTPPPPARISPLQRARTWLKRRRSQSSMGGGEDTNPTGFWQRVRRRLSGSSQPTLKAKGP
uniref:Protein phosphatase n=1 Tax=Chromera velia CCMP2878 TaxID=1169474 RepID=A0A0G4I5Y4_9ALVE|eukprot:Cvel_11234.t1-p1 / transcript=Cvel_11234.t1 / gene=Cvel_11234 / organism=Chromera_velia_CCMP2878 / gene_product=hypothetical protein / transcript_product=hypothetical protein / location=Cvel_scaffold699:51740-56149(+) / protein_length=636 / sequence_SO=supercontig / SO=protein_coding / is_pseudo=false